jgi:hypothetical protein
MIFSEDAKTYDLRRLDEHMKQQQEFLKRRTVRIHPFKQHILDIVQESGDDPIRITTVANRFAKETGHRWQSRAEREDLKKRAFRVIAELIKGFLLERHRRKWVRWPSPDNPRRKAFLQRIEANLKSLPKPQLG